MRQEGDDRLLREARFGARFAAAACLHDLIITSPLHIYAFVSIGGRAPLIAMELVRGETLDECFASSARCRSENQSWAYTF